MFINVQFMGYIPEKSSLDATMVSLHSCLLLFNEGELSCCLERWRLQVNKISFKPRRKERRLKTIKKITNNRYVPFDLSPGTRHAF